MLIRWLWKRKQRICRCPPPLQLLPGLSLQLRGRVQQSTYLLQYSQNDCPPSAWSSLSAMESKSIYPESFRVALEQKADSKKFDELFGSSDYLPVFVYGSLILPSVIDRVTQQDDVKKMV